MTRAEIRAVLLRDTWFASLPPALIDTIVERSIRREFCAGAPIYMSGDPPTGQFAVLEGSVKLTSTTLSGKQVIYGLFRPGSWFGHLSVLDEKPRFQDAVAAERTQLLFLPKAVFDALVDADPRYALDFARLVCQHIRVAMEMLAEALTAPLPARVAQALLEAADATDPGRGLATRMTQDGLAAMVGVTRQSINRILKAYKAQGLVDVRYGRIIVSDPQSLAALTRVH
ncbi:MAG: Crp/Fnr family transcriptional regulator [Hyphomicrobiales bacterium]|nr:Crp/Fnr family transcriptional regulator [Hyphomicrobiales bacterium]